MQTVAVADAQAQLACCPLWPTVYMFMISILWHPSQLQVKTIGNCPVVLCCPGGLYTLFSFWDSTLVSCFHRKMEAWQVFSLLISKAHAWWSLMIFATCQRSQGIHQHSLPLLCLQFVPSVSPHSVSNRLLPPLCKTFLGKFVKDHLILLHRNSF